ncbi:MAG: NAD(+)/NADH kinase [Lachnospiraceae bacterium]|uniref:NAD(+)/NADH kinase n=1 Tax=Parablautia sp. Marseille-Q6255 TaxID=3039593 RepID=UPI0024BCC608|nr:NAD(+)/NADH kinase [Parablautia sp. Marseille-Q6255]
MNTFYVITNYQKDPEFETAGRIKEYLESKGKVCSIQRTEEDAHQGSFRYTDAQKIPKDTECVLVLGGDGTLLQAARDLVECNIPLLGINMGTLGYLAEVEHRNIRHALDQLMAGEFSVESRMMLHGTVYHQNKKVLSDIALNDIVISRSGKLRVIDFKIYVDGVFLTAYSADGIIVSTPTGSTGYNLSVGGPIVAPQASLMLLTAVAPHTLVSRPIVLPDDVEITIEIVSRHSADGDGAVATFDGDTSVKLNFGNRIVITKSESRVRMVKTKNTSFLEILGEKMNN